GGAAVHEQVDDPLRLRREMRSGGRVARQRGQGHRAEAQAGLRQKTAAAGGAHRLVIASSRLSRVWATTAHAASSFGSHLGSYFAAPTARSRFAAAGSAANRP